MIIQDRLKEFYSSSIVTHLHNSCFKVAVKDNNIVGEISSFRGDLIPTYMRNTAQIVSGYNEEYKKVLSVLKTLMSSREAEDDEYYIDTVSVHPDFRNQGIAEYLINSAILKAKEQGFSKVVLFVDVKKPNVQKYYEKLNFKFLRKCDPINGIQYNKMIYNITI